MTVVKPPAAAISVVLVQYVLYFPLYVDQSKKVTHVLFGRRREFIVVGTSNSMYGAPGYFNGIIVLGSYLVPE